MKLTVVLDKKYRVGLFLWAFWYMVDPKRALHWLNTNIDPCHFKDGLPAFGD
jgi:hypothetical protein